MDNWALVAGERQALIDLFRTLEPEQWQVKSLCPAWTVHDVLAHLTSVLAASPWDMARAAALGLGLPSQVTVVLARQWARQTPEQLIEELQLKVDSRFTPPGLGYRAPLTDVMVHRLDIAIPLGIEAQRPAASWRPVLDLFTAKIPMMGTIRGGRPRVTWKATDLGWSSGKGPAVSGTAEAIGYTMAGRGAMLDRLEGPGVKQLTDWLSA